MSIPTAHQALKLAGLAEVGTAATVGAILSGVAQRIPAIAQLRQTNPTLYDAALAAGTVQLMEALGDHELQHDQSYVPLRAV